MRWFACKTLETILGGSRRVNRFEKRPYFEYNSTTRLTLIVEGRSEREGSALNLPFISLALTSTHSGKPRVSAAVTEPFKRNCSFALADTSTVSPSRTLYEGMFTR